MARNRTLSIRWVPLLVLAFAAPASGGSVRYRVTPLGTLQGGAWSEAAALNESGVVVGRAATARSTEAFVWKDGEMRGLGVPPGFLSSAATDVNEAGQIVGVMEHTDHQPFLYDGGVMRNLNDLADPDAGWYLMTANAINDRGQVVGMGLNWKRQPRAYVWSPDGSVRDLGTLGGDASEAADINNAGHVVGWSRAADGTDLPRAFLHDGEAMRHLGTLPGDHYSFARSINDAGEVVGESYFIEQGFGNFSKGFFYDDGVMRRMSGGGDFTDVGGVNARGESVVYGSMWDGPPEGAQLNVRGGRHLDLAELAGSVWEFTGAGDVNDRGWIATHGRRGPEDEGQALLLTPRGDGGPQPIPLPPGLWPAALTLAVAGAFTAFRVRKRRNAAADDAAFAAGWSACGCDTLRGRYARHHPALRAAVHCRRRGHAPRDGTANGDRLLKYTPPREEPQGRSGRMAADAAGVPLVILAKGGGGRALLLATGFGNRLEGPLVASGRRVRAGAAGVLR